MFIWQVRSSSLTIALERAKKGENKAFGPPGQVGFHARQANFLPPWLSHGGGHRQTSQFTISQFS